MRNFLSHINKGLFKGRVNRKQFFFGLFFLLLVGVILRLIHPPGGFLLTDIFFGIIGFLIFVLYASLIVRRIQDIGKPVLNYIIMLMIPIFGFFVLAYLFLKRGSKESNKYGPPNTETNFFKMLLNI